jgi:hypothetical protein
MNGYKALQACVCRRYVTHRYIYFQLHVKPNFLQLFTPTNYNIVVPPYSLIELSAVYRCPPKNWKIKEINGS